MNWEKVRQQEYVRSFNPDLNTARLTSRMGGLDRVTRKLKQHENCATCGDTILGTTHAKFWIYKKKYTHMDCDRP